MTKTKDTTHYLAKWQQPLSEICYASDHNHWMQEAKLAFINNHKLQECLNTEEGRTSAFYALQLAASTGLSLNPQKSESCLVPYKGKVQFQAMKNGMLRRLNESEKVASIDCDVVYEQDSWKCWKGSDGDGFQHMPADGDRGPIRGFWAFVRLHGQSGVLKYMSVGQVEEHRDKYHSGSLTDNSAWVKSFAGMGLKTVLKYLCRNTYVGEGVQRIVNADDKAECQPITIDVQPAKGVTAEQAMERLEQTQSEPVQEVIPEGSVF
jgi:phage RecT family recombinase